jgi:hypothetical protein
VRKSFILLGAALAVLAATPGYAANLAAANAGATLVSAISISNTTSLAFGQFVASGSAGTVQMTAGGSRFPAGGASLGNAAGASPASFNVTGQANATYAITLPGPATIASGANTLTVNNFGSLPSSTGTLSAGGTQTLAVGAQLQVGINQAQGNYTGTFTVTVAYN